VQNSGHDTSLSGLAFCTGRVSLKPKWQLRPRLAFNLPCKGKKVQMETLIIGEALLGSFDVGADGVARYFAVVQNCTAAAKLRAAGK
jgi:hypothetical protein